MRVLAYHVVCAANVSGPLRLFPRAAARRNVFERCNLGRDAFEVLEVPEIPRAAGGFQKKKPMPLRKFIIPGVAGERADIAHEGRDSGDGTEQQMVSTLLAIECKAALGYFAQCKLVAHLQLVQRRRQFAPRNQLEEKLQFVLVRRGDNRIGAFDMFLWRDDTQGRVLSRQQCELSSRLYANGP